ncbi:VCBS repeat-containing protein [Winogradskyella sp. DF17]|uniref:VCBS repeat-containing protein n=1 Tax=Winogradskyella pelagia TaxID=2819984 RepID=A0ABS3T3I4_9FLAO|nr:FG-GAP-like repeat-containing protein [Winogradskyella sp. DF17]MBO3117297.1 VCBS repeat-containing protein [Winogradskyella sp. DF17]
MKNPLVFRILVILFFGCGWGSFFLNAQVFERIEDVVGLSVLEKNNGIAVADYDRDNDLDIFVVANAVEDSDDPSSFSRLFRNNNDGTFTDVTEFAGFVDLLTQDDNPEETLAQQGFKFSASWGDYNNDGFPDLFLTYSLKVQLWRNLGNGTFVNVTAISGFDSTDNCMNTGATWFDYNNDGLLDIYISDWNRCGSNSLYRNNGNNTFSNVTADLGLIETESRLSYTPFPVDINEDGWMDLIVTNDVEDANYFYLNQSGTSFIEIAQTYGLDSMIDDMGIAISDFDLDEDFDFFITGIDENALLENNGVLNFSETSANYGIGGTGWSWGARFADFDLDTDEDLFVVNGYDFFSRGAEQNVYFRNLHGQGQPMFEDASVELGLNALTESVEALDFDYDNDGDLDIIVTNGDGGVLFYENKLLNFDDTQSTLNWLKVQLEGTVSNRDAIGTELTLTTSNTVLKRHHSGVGFFSQSLKGVHFGLNDITDILSLQVKWPSGLIETYNDLASNTTVKLTEGQGLEVLDILPSQKIYGCTDPLSCSYNPDANVNDGSCTYIESQPIVGSLNSSFLSVETYSYNLNANSTANWQVQGGEILSGQGTGSITVRWHIEDTGMLTVVESDSQCSSLETSVTVDLGINTLSPDISIARLWNEALLQAIRGDFARPTVHARNLFHSSVAMYDIWAIYDNVAEPYLIGNSLNGFDSSLDAFTPNESIDVSVEKAISYAMYRLLTHRFQNSPGVESSQAIFDLLMQRYGYDTSVSSLLYQDGDAAALGNYVAQTLIDYGLQDGSREATGYDNAYYEPVNAPYALDSNENAPINDPNRWQPLGLDTFIDQGGNLVDGNVPPFLSPEWGNVFSFALKEEDKVTYEREGNQFNVFHDPSDPPYISLTDSNASSDQYKWGFTMVSVWQSHLDPFDGVMWDISPNSIGNVDISTFPTDFADYPNFYDYFNGGSTSAGHALNPITGSPYEVNMVPRGDYARVLAEFWADGPDSETPPGHWFTILNYVSDHPQFERRFQGEGAILDPLEWDVKSYFVLGGGMHDSAIAAWSVKGWYDYIRPISAIRSMVERGQSTDSNLDNYDVGGIPLIDGYIEIIEEGDPLAGFVNQYVGDIKLFTWKGHDFIDDTDTDMAGVGWIRADEWYPYQRPTFVTPPFAGYVSGHSTYSRAAAELLTMMTGSPFFPGGLGEFVAKQNEFLVFEEGPSVDVVLQWATYRDASDQTSLSRIWGGIHPPADDIPGRFIGQAVAEDTFNFALPYFEGNLSIDESIFINQVAFPNPMINSQITVSNTLISDSIKFYDLRGRDIPVVSKNFDSNSNSTTIRFNDLTSGLYVLVVNGNSHKIMVRD